MTEGRVGNLVFFWMTLWLTWLLAGGTSRQQAAGLAASLVATLPPMVAHSGLATTDVGFVAMFMLALLAWQRLLLKPTGSRAAFFGLAAGLAVTTKFTTLVFFPPAALAVLLDSRKWSPAWRPFSARRSGQLVVVALSVMAFTIWASYGFSVGKLSELPARFGPYGSMPTSGWVPLVANWPLPAYEFVLSAAQTSTSAASSSKRA